MTRTTLVLDESSAIVIDDNDFTLATELIRHFKPEWQRLAADAQSSGKEVSAAEYVHALFHNLAIKHDTIEPWNIVPISILSAEPVPEKAVVPAEGEKPTEKAESSAEPAKAPEEIPAEPATPSEPATQPPEPVIPPATAPKERKSRSTKAAAVEAPAEQSTEEVAETAPLLEEEDPVFGDGYTSEEGSGNTAPWD